MGATAYRWRWVHVALAALAMVATLPGRTHGLGLFTEPILSNLHLDRESYGFLNLWATLLGGLFCLPCGWLLDRLGTRAVLPGVAAGLGITVVAMSRVSGTWTGALDLPLPVALGGSLRLVVPWDLFLFLLLTRGLGQSALSVASLALIGRSAARRSGLAMGAYAFLTSAGFVGAFAALRPWVQAHPDDWRGQWSSIGVGVLAFAALEVVLVRRQALDADPASGESVAGGWTLGRVLLNPAFWVFSLGTSFYGLVTAGTSLFNESILRERLAPHGLTDAAIKAVFLNVTIISIPVGLAANLLTGWLATRWHLGRLLAAALALLAAALCAYRWVATEIEVYLYATVLAAAGGMVTVCFFTVWRQAYGLTHLGRIQGATQMLTVLASALGPQLFASAKVRLDSYQPLFGWLAATSAVLAVAAWVVRVPSTKPEAN